MALAPLSAFSNTSTAGNDVPNEIPNTQLDIIPNMPYVSDPNLNKYAINPAQYPRVTALLAGFMRGTRIKVTYFRQCQQGSSNIRTNLSDYSAERDTLTSEYERIYGFEITIPEKFSFSFDTSQSSADVNGQALFYAGLEPTVGDQFLYSAGNGKYGLYRISNVESMNWTNDRVFMASFTLQSFPDSSDVEGLVGPVIRDLNWTKMVSYGQCYSVISSQAYLLLQKIRVFRQELCHYYHRTFYSSELSSYVRPDGVYDPCAVLFVQGKISVQDIPLRAKLLYMVTDDMYDRSLWGRIDSRWITTLNGISSGYQFVTPKVDTLCTEINELFGRTVLIPNKYYPAGSQNIPVVNPNTGITTYEAGDDISAAGQEYYVFSQAFWTGDVANMTTLENAIYMLITTRSVTGPAQQLGDIMQNTYQLDAMTQYYTIPLYMHLIDLLIQYVPQDLDSPVSF